ncbi:MAG: HAD-IIA family hydrolase [Candidatus Limnocylindrales bacterium]
MTRATAAGNTAAGTGTGTGTVAAAGTATAAPADRAHLADPPHLLRERLAGVRGLLLDLDGVLVLKERALPGAVAAMERLERDGIPYRLVTNTSLVSRATLAGHLASVGFRVPVEHIMTAVSATAAYTARVFRGRPLYVLAAPDARTEFEGQHLLTHEEAAAADAEVAAVVVGDAAEEFTPANVGAAFRLIFRGAPLLAVHRNKWWFTAAGPTLDAGAWVAGLEFATDRRARVLGKPAAAFFGEAVRSLGLPRSELAMVGDDLWNDVLAGQRAGLRGVLVLTGKHGGPELERAAAGRRPARPDAVALSLAELVAALD